MAVCLLGECSPCRALFSKRGAFYDSIGRTIATACDLSLEQLLMVVDAKHLIPRYVPSWNKDKWYWEELEKVWQECNGEFVNYKLTIVVGRRLQRIVGMTSNEFFCCEVIKGLTLAAIPNPEKCLHDGSNYEIDKTWMNAVLSLHA